MDQPESRNWKPVGSGRVKLGNEIGRGAESKVYLGSFGEKLYAVKEMLHGNENEMEMLSHLDHENIIRYIYTERVETRIYTVLELCYCNLKQYVETKHKEIPLPRIKILEQVVEGVNYLHNGQQSWTVHRDLKPSNILFQHIERDNAWKVKISDFGLSKDMDPDKTSTLSIPRGTAGYKAPELLDLPDGSKGIGRVGKEIDIFSLGVIFHYTLSDGKHPFSNDPYAMDKEVRDGKANLCDLMEVYKSDAETLILSMIEKDWKKRATMPEIRAHFLFWTPKQKLSFFQEISDYLQDQGKHQKLINKLEKKCDEVTGGNWMEKISGPENPGIKEVFERREKQKRKNDEKRKGEPTKNEPKKNVQKFSLKGLLRQIRNWAHHYNDKETSEELRKDLGSLPEGLVQFFTSVFPSLLPCTYEVLRDNKNDPLVGKFYGMKNDAAVLGMPVPVSPKHSYMPEPVDDSDDDLLQLDGEDGNTSGSAARNTGILKLRKYQLELAEQALMGHNSLIIAPTGSGKTAVANEIIKQHLEKGNSKSILFFVPKTTLALQQYDCFSHYLKDQLNNKVSYLIGKNASDAPVGITMKAMKLTVLTPQILIDELNRKKSFIQFSDFSLMIFDECHNTHKKHPYKVIMDRLLDAQDKSQSPLHIQVVGMTASPGVGKGKDRDRVLENLITLLANLNVTQCPAVVVQNKDELKRYQNEIDECYIKVEVGLDTFSRKILIAIDLIEGKIRGMNMFGSAVHQVSEPPSDKSQQIYEHWVVSLINHVKLKIYDTDPQKSSTARIVVTYAEHLKMYYTLLYLKKHITNAIDVTNRLASFDQSGEEGDFLRKISSELQKVSKDSQVPMLEKLLQQLKKQFDLKEDSRCIIFVPRKLIASSLALCIRHDSALAHLEPEHLTGTNDEEASGGMTKTKQQASLEAFRSGKCKVLIATLVAEEGLDIRECNLVIMYNYVTGEVGRIQRAGRGRAENSRSILIAPYGSEKMERENMNAICAQATEVAIDAIHELSTSKRVKWIRDIQRKQAKERRIAAEDHQQQLQKASKWKILCGKCQAFITSADQLRQIKNQHKFVTDVEFLSRVTKKPLFEGQREIAPGVIGVGQFNCKDSKCRHYLGLEMQYKKKLYPTLTVKQLVFEDNVGNRTTSKQWSKCPFSTEDMEEDDEEDEQPKKAGSDGLHGACKKDGCGAEDMTEYELREALFLDNYM